MALVHTSVTPGESVHASRPEGHPMKRSYVPIKPAFRPLLPKPATRDPSPSNGIHIHTRATLNAGRKRLVTPKSLDLHKRRRSSQPPSSHADVAPQPSAFGVSSPVAVATGAVQQQQQQATPPKSSASPLDFQLSLSRSVIEEAFISPPTPVSAGDSPQGVSMASIIDQSPATIDPVYMVMEDELLGTTASASPADSLKIENPLDNLDELDSFSHSPEEMSNPFLESLNAGFSSAFDDLSDFYNRDLSASTDDVVSNFVETSEETEDRKNDFSVMDYFAPANDLF